MDFSAPTRPIPTTSSLFASTAPAVKPPSAVNPNGIPHPLQSQASASGASGSSSSSTSLKRTSTDLTDGLGASGSNTMPSLRSRSNKVAKNSQNGIELSNVPGQLQNGEQKSVSPPAPVYDPRDDQIKDLQTDLAKLQKCATCVVCQDLLFEPYSLGCGHVFCYSCLRDWFRQKKTCPECRARVKHQPAPAYLIRDMIDTFVQRAILQSPHEEGLALQQQKEEALRMVEADKSDPKGLFGGMFARRTDLQPIYDPADGVARCPDCNWEIEGRTCASCGRRFHTADMPGADSDASDVSEFSEEEDSELDDDDDSLAGSDASVRMDDDLDDEEEYHEESDNGWDEPDYDQDHRLALALQDSYHQEFMRYLGATPNWVEEHFGADRALAAREAARNAVERSISRNLSSPGRSLQPSSPYSRDSEDDSEEHTLDEDESEMDDFIVHDTPDRRPRRQQPGPRTLRRPRGSVADLSDDEDEDEDEDDEPVLRRGRNRYFERHPIIISSDNDEDDEEAAGLISAAGYAQLDHDTTTGDDDDDEDSLDESLGRVLRPAGPLRANTMPATINTTTTTSIGGRRNMREQSAIEQQRSATPPVTRRRRRTVTFQVPDDADGENDSDTRDGDGDLDMDRHSRAGSTSLASITSNRTDASTRSNRSGGNSFSQDTPSVNGDESSDDSLPRQRRRRAGNTTSLSNLRRAATAHPTGGSRNRAARPANNVDPMVHRLLRTFNAQRNESQLEGLGMSVLENPIAFTPGPRSASHDLQELNDPIVITSSPAPTFFQRDGHRASVGAQVASRESSQNPLSPSPPQSLTPSRGVSVLSNDSTPRPSTTSPTVNAMTAALSSVTAENNTWGAVAAPSSTTSSTAATLGSTQSGLSNRGMRTRRSNAALRGQDIQRTGTPTGRNATRSSRNPGHAPADNRDLQGRARDFLAQRTREVQAANANGQASNNPRATRSNQAATTAMSLQQRIAANREAANRARDSATPTPSAQNQQTSSDPAPPRSLTRTDTAGSGRRLGFQIGQGNNPGPLFVISDDDHH
ncbi:E3 ubiquitin ligase [Arthrobotrys musiformis]|uniref:E3 ubiquitin ligase n=1 Tax=Arthrobotrys musiformis TaxID=47236 RepID=A0AAV9WDX6_9PEZI